MNAVDTVEIRLARLEVEVRSGFQRLEDRMDAGNELRRTQMDHAVAKIDEIKSALVQEINETNQSLNEHDDRIEKLEHESEKRKGGMTAFLVMLGGCGAAGAAISKALETFIGVK